MSVANFIMSLGVDPKGVGQGVDKAINHFKRLDDQAKKIAQKRQEVIKRDKEETERALRPEEKLNKLLEQREFILRRLSQTQSEIARKGYQQKLGDISGSISQLQKETHWATRLQNSALFAQLSSRFPGLAGGISRALGYVGGGVGLGLAGVGALGVGAFSEGMHEASGIRSLALDAGISDAAAARLKYAASRKGADTGLVSGAVVHLSRAQSEALHGGESQNEAFRNLGFSGRDIARMSPDEMFFEISRRVRKGSINSGNLNSVFEVMGREAKDVLPYMRKGISDVADEFGRAGKALNSGVVKGLLDIKGVFKSGLGSATSKGKSAAVWTAGRFAQAGEYALGTLMGIASGAPGVDDARMSLLAHASLMFDDGNSEALNNADRLQGILDRSQAAREQTAEGTTDRWLARIKERKRKKRGREGAIEAGGGSSTPDVDELARIGLFIGGSGPTANIPLQQLNTLRGMDEKLLRISDSLES